MKKFARNRSLKEIRSICLQKGWILSTEKLEDGSSDYVSVRFQVGDTSGMALISTFNGMLIGETDAGEVFDATTDDHEGEPWFEALLDLAYAEPVQAKGQRRKVATTKSTLP